MKLPFVLARKAGREEPDVASLRSGEAKSAARFWVGKQAASRKDDCIAQVTAAMKDPARVREIIGSLRPEERRVVGVVERYGAERLASATASFYDAVLARRGRLSRKGSSSAQAESTGMSRHEAQELERT